MKADRATLVARSFAESISDEQKPFIADTVILDSELLARIAEVPPELDPSLLPGLLSTVTPLRPFLRWNPVQPPAVVSRHRFTIGESLRQLVIRSGVTQDLETLQIIVTSSEAYADEYVHLGYRQTSERHVVPPKTSFSEAELHGAFDAAIGSNDLDDQRKQLAVALRESGTLFDIDVPRLDDPSQREPQNGIKLVSDPQVPASVLKELPLPPGTMPAPGQYVIHDTDLLVLPYLPDVVARGISLVFPEAGRDRQIIFPFGTEGLSVDYEGTWPERHPFRLVLANSPQLHGSVAGNVVRIGLPPGDIQRFRLSSSLHRADLNLFGLWLSLPETLRQNKDVIEAATDGWLWAFTPFEEVTLVHAVPRPLEAPRPITLRARRPGEGETDAVILGAVDVHGPSTEMLTAEASWIDPVDDLSLPAPEDRTECGMAFKTPIRAEEDLAVLYGGSEDARVNVPGAGPVWLHSAIHRLNDTRHRTIRYRFRASTRFREYFDAETLRPANSGGAVSSDPNHPVDDGQSVVGPLITVSVPSSAKPAAPIVHSVLPLFRWDEGTEPEQPVAVRHRRRTGVRIYLERPWYSSGEDELLGVLLAPAGNDAYLDKLVSQWGSDPVWLGAPVNRRAMYLELDNLLRAIGFDDRPNDALPVVPPANLPLAAHPKSPTVTVLGYRPLYSAERHMWYVDVAIDPGSTFWPFVRLAVVRYQPNSIPGCHLSAPVLCDFVQLTPERTTSVSRTDLRHIRVVVSGPVGFRDRPSGIPKAQLSPLSITEMAEWAAKNRKVVARLQRRDPIIDTDLGWENVTAVELTIKGYGRNSFEASWVGELEAPEDLPLRRPGENPDWRITVEEWERLAGDPADLYVEDDRSSLVWEQRLVYADEIGL